MKKFKKLLIFAGFALMAQPVLADNLTLRSALSVQSDYAFPEIGFSYAFIQFPNDTGFSIDGDLIYYGNKNTGYGSVFSTAQMAGLSFYNKINGKIMFAFGAGIMSKQERIFCDAGQNCPNAQSGVQNYFKILPSYLFKNGISVGLQWILTTESSNDEVKIGNIGLTLNYKFN